MGERIKNEEEKENRKNEDEAVYNSAPSKSKTKNNAYESDTDEEIERIKNEEEKKIKNHERKMLTSDPSTSKKTNAYDCDTDEEDTDTEVIKAEKQDPIKNNIEKESNSNSCHLDEEE